MFRRLISILAFAAVTVCAGAEGYNVAFKTENTIVFATITQDANSDKSLADAVSEVNNYADYQGNRVSVHETAIVGNISDGDMVALSGLTSVRINLSEAVCDISKLQKGYANYIILPDGLSKEDVNKIGTNFNAVASKKAVTEKQTKWVYDNDVIYEGWPVENNGVYTGTVKTTVELTKTSESYQMNGSEYNGKVFVDDNGTCYGISDENQLVELTVEQGYTYNNGTVKYTGKVAEVEGKKYYGVVNPTEEREITYDQEVKYTYTNYDNNKYAWLGNVYNNGEIVFFTGGKEYEVTTSNFYTYYNNGNNIFEGDLTRTDTNGNVYGNVGGEKVSLKEEEAYYYNYDTQLYTGATRQDAEGNLYGNTGTPVNLITKEGFVDNNNQVYSGLFRQDGNTYYGVYVYGNQKTISREQKAYTYTDNYSNTYIYDSGYITKDNKGYVGGKAYEMHTAEGDALYFYYDAGLSCYYDGEVTIKEEWGNISYTGIINGETVYLNKYGKNTLNYYINNERNIIYEGDIYYKGETPYACLDGSQYPLTEAENIMYYEDNGKKIVYTGNIYYSQDTNDTNEYGVINTYEWEIKKATLYYYYDETRYTGNIYYDAEGNIIGFINSYEVQLTKGIRYYYTDAQSNKVTYSGSIYTQDTNIFGFIGGTEYQLTYQENGKYYIDDNKEKIICSNGVNNTYISIDGKYAYVGGTATALAVNDSVQICNTYTDNNDRTVIYEGKIYGGNTAYIGGTEVELTYGDIYMNGENMYTGYRTADNEYGYTGSFTQLTTNFTYTYTDPTDGTEKEYPSTSYLETLEVDRTVTLTSKEVDVPTGKLHLTAYVSVPGSLRKTLEYWGALGNNNAHNFGVGNITELTISGNLKGSDIANGNNLIKEDGHAFIYNGTVEAQGQIKATSPIEAMTNAPLTYIDLRDAVFETQTDMNLQLLGSGSTLKKVIFPVSSEMTTIPDNCLSNHHSITEICIPGNIKRICAAAFHNNNQLSHFTTTDIDENGDGIGALRDNGPLTMTLPAGLEYIGKNAFGLVERITDVYNLATTAPECEKDAFSAGSLVGWGGFNSNSPITRNSYVRTEDKTFAVLHWPAGIDETQLKRYTDVTRKYSIVDEMQTTDGDGNTYIWPNQLEYNHAFSQASNGYLWNAWDKTLSTNVNLTQETANEYYNNSTNANKSNCVFYNTAVTEGGDSLIYDTDIYNKDYRGWHQFVLTGSYNYENPDEYVWSFDEYKKNDWYSICVPFDMTEDDVLKIFGVDASEGPAYITDLDGNIEEVEKGSKVYPYICTLRNVKRDLESRVITLQFCKNLCDTDNKDYKVINNKAEEIEWNAENGNVNAKGKRIIIRAGHPYLIKPYMPVEMEESFSRGIATYAKKIFIYPEFTNNDRDWNNEKQAKLPYTDWIINSTDANGTELTNENAFQYVFLGTYTDVPVKEFTYFIANNGKKNVWYYHSWGDSWKGTWAANSCVIAPFHVNITENRPQYTGNHTDTSAAESWRINFTTGTDNLIYPDGKSKKATFVMEFSGSDSETTAIENIESNGKITTKPYGKIYSLSGQLVRSEGETNNLPKGIYIINGKKFIVD